MFIEEFISTNTPDTFEKVLATKKVGRLYAFGSSTLDGNPRDIDLLVEMDEVDPIKKGENLISLWDYFEDYFGKKVDLITLKSLKNPVLIKNIESTKKLIYEKGQYKISA